MLWTKAAGKGRRADGLSGGHPGQARQRCCCRSVPYRDKGRTGPKTSLRFDYTRDFVLRLREASTGPRQTKVTKTMRNKRARTKTDYPTTRAGIGDPCKSPPPSAGLAHLRLCWPWARELTTVAGTLLQMMWGCSALSHPLPASPLLQLSCPEWLGLAGQWGQLLRTGA